MGPRTRFKLRYAVQTSINPQRFVIFASRPDAVTEAYVAFLRNKIREELGMDMIPLTLEVKASHVPIVRAGPTRADKIKAAAARPAPAPRAGTSKKVKKAAAAHQGPAEKRAVSAKAVAAKKKASGNKDNAAKKSSVERRGAVEKRVARSAAGKKAGAGRKGAGAAGKTAATDSRSSSRAADPRKRKRDAG